MAPAGKLISLTLLAAWAATGLEAQPSISGVTNNYSFVPNGMPNHGIAQGSIFAIFGTGLANTATPVQSIPLKTSLAGVSITVSVGVTTVYPLLYYVAPSQIGAILPSSTPVGAGQITVSLDGQTSAPASLLVVANAFGILTRNQAGTGPAAAFDSKARYLGFTNAANPGDIITLWGSGLGATAEEESGLQTPRDLAQFPIQVFVGGVEAPVQYHGRSIYPGLDQINIVVPASPPGCYVSVVVRSGAVVSNFATIPIATSGRSCSDAHTLFDGASADGKAQYTIGELEFGTESVDRETGVGYFNAAFERYGAAQLSGRIPRSTPSIGSCVVYDFFGPGPAFKDPVGPTLLDAGPSIDGIPNQDGNYAKALATPFKPGDWYFFTNGSGGRDLGPFEIGAGLAGSDGNGAFFGFGEAGVAAWVTYAQGPIDRSQGLRVTWQPAGFRNPYIQVSGISFADGGDAAPGAAFYCAVWSGAVKGGSQFVSFTIPSEVLLALPPSGPGTKSTLSVATYGVNKLFPVEGADFAGITGYYKDTTRVSYR